MAALIVFRDNSMNPFDEAPMACFSLMKSDLFNIPLKPFSPVINSDL